MEDIGKVTLATIELFNKIISFNPNMLYMTWLIMGLFLLMGYFATRKLSLVPGKIQNIFELILGFFKEIVYSTLGEKEGKKHFPLILTLFIFILLSNWIGIIPNFFRVLVFIGGLIMKLFSATSVSVVFESLTNSFLKIDIHSLLPAINPHNVWYSFLFEASSFEEPTKFLSTDLGMAILVLITVHVSAIKNKGFLKYFKSYMEPLPEEAPYIYFFWLNPFFYLNIIGQLANTVSHSFRLFGNIFGGGIIILIVSELLRYFLVPVGLFGFFGLFAGTIQAFVFSMLAVSYIAQMQ